MSTNCFDHVPPATRDNAIEIAADLVRSVDGEHRPLACEAARKLRDMHDSAKATAGKMRALCEDHRNIFDSELAYALSKVVHDRCSNVPHDIGLTLVQELAEHVEVNSQTEKSGHSATQHR